MSALNADAMDKERLGMYAESLTDKETIKALPNGMPLLFLLEQSLLVSVYQPMLDSTRPNGRCSQSNDRVISL